MHSVLPGVSEQMAKLASSSSSGLSVTTLRLEPLTVTPNDACKTQSGREGQRLDGGRAGAAGGRRALCVLRAARILRGVAQLS